MILKMSEELKKKEAKRKKSLGELGELFGIKALVDESFENIEVANLMNDAFINIKVDREERPDIDNIYMSKL